MVTCVGKVFHTYGCSKLGLLSVSKAHPEDITCIAADSFMVFTAAGGVIYAWRRGHELKHIYKVSEDKEKKKSKKKGKKAPDIKLMLPFGPHLLAVDGKNMLKVGVFNNLCWI